MAESGYYDQYQGAAADEGEQYAEDEEYYEEYEEGKPKKGNILPIWVSNEQWPKKTFVCQHALQDPIHLFSGKSAIYEHESAYSHKYPKLAIFQS